MNLATERAKLLRKTLRKESSSRPIKKQKLEIEFVSFNLTALFRKCNRKKTKTLNFSLVVQLETHFFRALTVEEVYFSD